MKIMKLICRWTVFIVLLMFTLQETNGGHFPSMNDQFWRSWSGVIDRPPWEIGFGLVTAFIALGVLFGKNVARWPAVALLSYECLRGLILCVSTSDFQRAGDAIGSAGAAGLCIMFLIRPEFGLRQPSAASQR
ncbi:MAG TPA: hypothetical protein VGT03_03210 [Candidatus Acidoferrales bacterium]|nr:hypothetical protein [Candidatus Acidoferrales bacterium]